MSLRDYYTSVSYNMYKSVFGTAREVLEGSGGACVTSTVVLDAKLRELW